MDTVTRYCPHCAADTEQNVRVRASGKHYADAICGECGKHAGFISKPDGDPTKYKRPKAHTSLVTKFSRGFCEMCLCPKADLPKGRTLEAHHVVEYQDGGEATRENVWILCTQCHSLVNWVRTYKHAPDHRESVQQVAEATTSWRT